MYLQLMRNYKRLNLINVEFSKISPVLSLDDQKPFLLVKEKGEEYPYLSFVYGNAVYMTPFRILNTAVISRLRTVLSKLDSDQKDINIPLFLVRNGIPIKELEFIENKAVAKEISPWEALKYQDLPRSKVSHLLRDLRELLYV